MTLRVGVDVGISGTLQLSGSVSGEGAPQGTAALTPSAYASVDASVSVSFLVSVELCKYLKTSNSLHNDTEDSYILAYTESRYLSFHV